MLFLLGTMTFAQPILHQDLKWRAIHDTVMGGVSSGTIQKSDEALLFEGFLSLENNGGFTSTRARVNESISQRTKSIRLRVIGDGRTYFATLRTAENPMIYYRRSFPTNAGVETEIEIPLMDFRPHAYGRLLPQVPLLSLQSYPIENIGFMLADKIQGPFSLQILSIELNGQSPQSPFLQSEQRRSLVDAIQKGVPLYNRGRSDLCAATYRKALVALQEDTGSRWFDPFLSQESSNQDHQAWWYRHMINHLLESQVN